MSNNNEVQVINNNGELVVSSRQVAENFGKPHNDVLKSIRETLGGLGNFSHTKEMFRLTTYIHSQNGQTYSEYLMNRDGFSLLAMGFTGTKALQWKIKYISAFNAMEKKLKEVSVPQSLDETLNADVLFLIASKWKADSDKCKELEVKVAELEAQLNVKSQVTPALLSAPEDDKRLYTVTDIAKDYEGMTARKLNELLIKFGIQKTIGSHKELCDGLDATKYVHYSLYKGNIVQMKWRALGKALIQSSMLEHGYVLK